MEALTFQRSDLIASLLPPNVLHSILPRLYPAVYGWTLSNHSGVATTDLQSSQYLLCELLTDSLQHYLVAQSQTHEA